MIRPLAIIFDYGNVLCRPQSHEDVQELASILDLEIPEFQPRYWRPRLAYDEASLDSASYWEIVAERAVDEVEIRRLNEIDGLSWTYAAPVMPEWASQIRASGLRTAILSNMPLPVRESLDQRNWLPEFDHRTFSCDVRMAKPGADIYLHSLRGLDIAPQEALFLDDKLENIRAAEALGIHSILYTTPRDLAEKIHNCYDIPPPPVATVGSGDEENQQA